MCKVLLRCHFNNLNYFLECPGLAGVGQNMEVRKLIFFSLEVLYHHDKA